MYRLDEESKKNFDLAPGADTHSYATECLPKLVGPKNVVIAE